MCEGRGNPTEQKHPLLRLEEEVHRFRARAGAGREQFEIAQGLIKLRHVIDLLELEFARDARAFAATDEFDNWASNTPIDWIRHNCHTSGHAAARAVTVGEAVEELLPQSVGALEAGRIGFGHLSLLASTALAIARSEEPAGFDEPELLALAEEHSVSVFQHDCHHARHAADAARFLDAHVEAVTWRRLELLPCSDGRLAFRGLLDPVGGSVLRTALEPLARRSGVGDVRHRTRRLADALVELSHHGLDSGVIPNRAGQRTHLQVTASLETLRGLAGAPAGELEYSTPIPAATVQRLACDAEVIRVLLGPESQVLDVGRARRVPSTAARRALAVRDRGCVWPGCERPASWTQVHHLQHWARHHGATDRDNLALVCARHHWMVHEGGWLLGQNDDGRWHAIPSVYTPRPCARGPDLSLA